MKELITALIKFQQQVPVIPKNHENKFFSQGGRKAMYADLATVISTCMPVLNKNELAIVQTLEVNGGMNALTTALYHSSGVCTHSTLLLPDIADPQKLTAAITYLRRAQYLAILGLVADEDDDGNSVGHQQQKQAAPKQEQAPQQPAPRKATDKQIALLKRLAGTSYVEPKSMEEAGQMIESWNNKRNPGGDPKGN